MPLYYVYSSMNILTWSKWKYEHIVFLSLCSHFPLSLLLARQRRCFNRIREHLILMVCVHFILKIASRIQTRSDEYERWVISHFTFVLCSVCFDRRKESKAKQKTNKPAKFKTKNHTTSERKWKQQQYQHPVACYRCVRGGVVAIKQMRHILKIYNGSIQTHTVQKIAHDACNSHLLIEMWLSFTRLHADSVFVPTADITADSTAAAADAYVCFGVYAWESSLFIQPLFVRLKRFVYFT